jgi:hypothetical protein
VTLEVVSTGALWDYVALIIRGKSKCSLCGGVLATGDEIVGFRAFLARGHRLWRQSDSALHASCYATWPERPEFERLYAEAEARRTASLTPERMEEARRVWNAARDAQSRSDREHNDRHAEIMTRVHAQGAACPHCRAHSDTYRELTSTARARLTCLVCGRSCNADELCFVTRP